MSKMKLTLLGSVMAFGLAPQVVAQDAVLIFADSDRYVASEPSATTTFQSLRDLGQSDAGQGTIEQVQPSQETSPPPAANPNIQQQAGLPLPAPISQNSLTSAPISQTTLSRPSAGTNMLDLPITALPSIADLVDRVSPSVVNIVVTTDTGETTSECQGSGFIISDKLEVVTNYHVIEGGTNIEIEFNDGRRYDAKILGTDEETDLALLQIQTTDRIPHVNFHQPRDLRTVSYTHLTLPTIYSV